MTLLCSPSTRFCSGGHTGCAVGMLRTHARLPRRCARRLLSSRAIESVTQHLLASDEPSRESVFEFNRVLPPTPISILALTKAASEAGRAEMQLLNAKFVLRELTSRRAYGLSMLLKAEHMSSPGLQALLQQPQVQTLKQAYWRRLRLLLEQPRLTSTEEEEAFYGRMQTDFYAQEGETRAAIGQALAALKDERGDDAEEELEISAFLDSFFSQRVALRFLVEHYLASKQPRDGFAGVIQMDCSPVALMEELGSSVEQKMHDTFGASPRVEVHGDRDATFCYAPTHVEFMVGELLGNAAKATVKHHLQTDTGRLTNLPPVKVIMAASDAHVTIKVADTAGGIPRSQLRNVWSYRGKALKRWGQGVGLGLPLARLYAKYFGGSMHAVPMEGHGTDCYVVLNRLADANCEKILKVPSFTAAAREEEMRAALDSEERPNQGRWRHAIRLFDAQARRGGGLPDANSA